MSNLSKCIFCQQENLAILFQDAKLALFKDIRPAAEHHYLVIPKEHVPNVKYLNKNNIPLLEEMKSFALNYFSTNINNYDVNKLRMGFHWAPFNSVAHLHLHLIYPADQMSFLSRSIVFRPNSWWFTEFDATIEYLREKKST